MAYDWRYTPKTVMTLKGVRRVVRVISHPPGKHPPEVPIIPNLTALQLITDTGVSHWVGVEDAKINAELRMVVRGGFINPRNELARNWKPCRRACAGLGSTRR